MITSHAFAKQRKTLVHLDTLVYVTFFLNLIKKYGCRRVDGLGCIILYLHICSTPIDQCIDTWARNNRLHVSHTSQLTAKDKSCVSKYGED